MPASDPLAFETFHLSAFDVKQIRQGLKLLAKELEKGIKQDEEKCGLPADVKYVELQNIAGHDEVIGLLQRFAPQVDAFERRTGASMPELPFDDEE